MFRKSSERQKEKKNIVTVKVFMNHVSTSHVINATIYL